MSDREIANSQMSAAAEVTAKPGAGESSAGESNGGADGSGDALPALAEVEREALLRHVGDEAFEALWLAVDGDFENDKLHNALVSYCVTQRMLPEAAGRYRVMRYSPLRRATAEKRLRGILTAAAMMLEETRTEPAGRPSKWWTWVGILLSFVLLGLLANAILRR
jgi:hypothetical protein